MSGGLFTYREVRNLRKAAATAAPREQAGSPKQAGTPPRQSGPAPEQTGTAPEQTGTTPENRKKRQDEPEGIPAIRNPVSRTEMRPAERNGRRVTRKPAVPDGRGRRLRESPEKSKNLPNN